MELIGEYLSIKERLEEGHKKHSIFALDEEEVKLLVSILTEEGYPLKYVKNSMSENHYSIRYK